MTSPNLTGDQLTLKHNKKDFSVARKLSGRPIMYYFHTYVDSYTLGLLLKDKEGQ